MMRLPFIKFIISLTPCGLLERSDNQTAFHKMCNVTHKLLVIEGVKLPSQNVQWSHSQTVGHRKRYGETTFHKMCNVVLY